MAKTKKTKKITKKSVSKKSVSKKEKKEKVVRKKSDIAAFKATVLDELEGIFGDDEVSKVVKKRGTKEIMPHIVADEFSVRVACSQKPNWRKSLDEAVEAAGGDIPIAICSDVEAKRNVAIIPLENFYDLLADLAGEE